MFNEDEAETFNIEAFTHTYVAYTNTQLLHGLSVTITDLRNWANNYVDDPNAAAQDSGHVHLWRAFGRYLNLGGKIIKDSVNERIIAVQVNRLADCVLEANRTRNWFNVLVAAPPIRVMLSAIADQNRFSELRSLVDAFETNTAFSIQIMLNRALAADIANRLLLAGGVMPEFDNDTDDYSEDEADTDSAMTDDEYDSNDE